MRFLALLLGGIVWKTASPVIAVVLRLRGVKVGRNFYTESVPILKLAGPAQNIRIGNDVMFTGAVELRNRENGGIRIGNGCKIDQGVRLVAANGAVLSIGEKTNIGPYCQVNCGADVSIGSKCLIAAFSVIQSSDHSAHKDEWIKDQGYEYGKITIGDDVWLGSHVSVLRGVSIARGAVVGSKAVVNSDLPEYAIAVGVPAKVIRFREAK